LVKTKPPAHAACDEVAMSFEPPRPQAPEREPVFNAPWPALAIAGVIVAGFAVQTRFPMEPVIADYAFSPAGLDEGRWITLVSALFLHGGWAHALMNAGFALAFGAPVARVFGMRPRGVAGFFAFYLACGALSSLGYAAVHPHQIEPLIGASGAVSGLMGAAARLIARRGRLGPIFSSPVIGMGAAWIVINLLIAVLGFAPGAGDATVAWEAHLAGFAAGVLLIGPFLWASDRTGDRLH
jgi:membrane associated rhomboid family serine protease